MQSVKTTGRELIGGRRVTNCCRRRPTTKDGHCYTGGSLRALPSPLLIDNVFFFRPPSLSLSFLLFSFTLVSYTLLLLGESDGGLGPRHREEQAGWNGTVVSISEDVYAWSFRGLEGLRKRFDGVQTGDTGSFPQKSLTGRRPGRSISSLNIFVYPV